MIIAVLCASSPGPMFSFIDERYCCPPAATPLAALVLALGAGNAKRRSIRPTTWPTPSARTTTSIRSTKSSSKASSMYREANTFNPIKRRRRHATLSALPSNRYRGPRVLLRA